MFRWPGLSVYRHLDKLSPEVPFGILNNKPYDTGPNSGYWFVRRYLDEIEAGHPSAEKYILDWWNEDCSNTHMPWQEQGTLRKLMHGDFPGGDGEFWLECSVERQ